MRLVERPGQVVSRDQLLDAVRGPEFEEAGAAKWHIRHLRRKLGDDPKAPEIIVNSRGAGYRYEKPVL